KEVPIFALVVGKNGTKNMQVSELTGENMSPNGSRLIFKGYTMQRLAEFLSVLPAIGRPVEDRTALQGRFDFTLDVLGEKPESIDNVKMAMARWDTILSDVQEQLGLRFESAKGSVETIVIDHAEKPIDNDH